MKSTQESFYYLVGLFQPRANDFFLRFRPREYWEELDEHFSLAFSMW